MKKLIFAFLMLLYTVKGFAYSGNTHLDFNTHYNCGEFVVFIHDTDQVRISSIYADLTISFIDSTVIPDFSPSTINSSGGYPIHTYSHIRYTDPAFFDYLGPVILDSSNVSGSRYHAYRFIFKSYASFNNTLTFFNLKTELGPDNYKWANYYFKNCGTCLRYPSRLELSLFISDILWNDPANEYGSIDLSMYSGYSTAYASMTAGKKASVTQLLNWILNYNVTASDYSTAFSTTIDSLSLPSAFYAPGVVRPSFDCPCKSALLNLLFFVKSYFAANGTATAQVNYVKKILNYNTYYECSCAGNYYFFLTRKEQIITIRCEPVYSDLPYMIYVIDADEPYDALVCSYEFDDNGGASVWPFIQTVPAPLEYNTVTHAFTVGAGYTRFRSGMDFQAMCELPCVDCLESFAPVPGRRYLVSGWAKEGGAPLTKTAYTYPEITILCPSVAYTSAPFKPAGAIIDGWQRIEGSFTVPPAATDLDIKLDCSGGSDCYFDDIRVLPFDGSMKTFVYDPVSLKLVAELDERNYATLYEYNEEGQLVRVKKETEKGVMTIKENRNNTKK